MGFNTRQDLVDYCLRQLGGGVVNIEVTPDQLDDSVNDAIAYYQEYHPDGVEQAYISTKVTATTLTLTSAAAFDVGTYLVGGTSGCRVRILHKNGNVISITRQVGTKLSVGETVTSTAGSTTITAITLGLTDLQYIQLDDPVVSVEKVLNLSSVLSSSDYMFNAQYQVMLSEIQNLASGSTQYLYSTMSYLGHLDFILRKEKTFRFNRRINRCYLDINWDADVTVNDYLVLSVYKALDDDTYEEILNDIWLKRYTTALIKKTWGQNLKKYNGMQMPGGLTYNGQIIFDEAMKDISTLEEEIRTLMSPLGFMVG